MQSHHLARAATFLAAAILLSLSGQVKADSNSSFSHQEGEFASNAGNLIYLAGAIALPELWRERDGKSASIRTVDSLGTTLVITEILKDTTREERPDSTSHDSFPSGHTSAAFAVATVESRFYPSQTPYWFLGATLIGASRLQLNRHHLQDVLAGAALGYGTSEWELSQRHGLILAPFITPNGSGLSVSFGIK